MTDEERLKQIEENWAGVKDDHAVKWLIKKVRELTQMNYRQTHKLLDRSSENQKLKEEIDKIFNGEEIPLLYALQDQHLKTATEALEKFTEPHTSLNKMAEARAALKQIKGDG